MTQLRQVDEIDAEVLWTHRVFRDLLLLCPYQATDIHSRAVKGTEPDAAKGR